MFDAIFQLQETQTIEIQRQVPGHYDENYQWVDPAWGKVATLKFADIQPRRGDERAAETGTRYESDYRVYGAASHLTFEESVDEDDQVIRQGDRIKDAEDRLYLIVFPGYWGTHYEIDVENLNEKPDEENGNGNND